MNWINIVIQLFTNPAIQALLKEIETLFQKKMSVKSMAPIDHNVALKQAVDEIVAKYVSRPT